MPEPCALGEQQWTRQTSFSLQSLESLRKDKSDFTCVFCKIIPESSSQYILKWYSSVINIRHIDTYLTRVEVDVTKCFSWPSSPLKFSLEAPGRPLSLQDWVDEPCWINLNLSILLTSALLWKTEWFIPQLILLRVSKCTYLWSSVISSTWGGTTSIQSQICSEHLKIYMTIIHRGLSLRKCFALRES